MSDHPPTSILPQTVRQFIDAVNSSNSQQAVAAFAADALVNDIRREFAGIDAIRAWLDREIIGDTVRLQILEARAHYKTTIVTARTTGTFDKKSLPDPLDLTYYFTSTAGMITELVVIANQPTPDWAVGQPIAF